MRQERRQTLAERGIHQSLDATLADAGKRAQGDAQKIQSEREGLAVKVSSRDHIARRVFGVGDEDQRIIHSGVCLGLKHFTAMRQCVTYRSMVLRNAAQRVSVLHAATSAMRFANLAAFEHLA